MKINDSTLSSGGGSVGGSSSSSGSPEDFKWSWGGDGGGDSAPLLTEMLLFLYL